MASGSGKSAGKGKGKGHASSTTPVSTPDHSWPGSSNQKVIEDKYGSYLEVAPRTCVLYFTPRIPRIMATAQQLPAVKFPGMPRARVRREKLKLPVWLPMALWARATLLQGRVQTCCRANLLARLLQKQLAKVKAKPRVRVLRVVKRVVLRVAAYYPSWRLQPLQVH